MLNTDIIALIRCCTYNVMMHSEWPTSFQCFDEGTVFEKSDYIKILIEEAPHLVMMLDNECWRGKGDEGIY